MIIMPDPEELTKYVGYFVTFALLLIIGVIAINGIAGPAMSSNNSTPGAFDGLMKNMGTQINQGFSLLSMGAVIFGAVIVLKALNVF
jgi:hypothetical protein